MAQHERNGETGGVSGEGGSLHIIMQGCTSQEELSCGNPNKHNVSIDPVNEHPMGSWALQSPVLSKW